MWATAILVLWDGRLPLFCHHRGSTKEESMSLDLLAIDLGKQSFQVLRHRRRWRDHLAEDQSRQSDQRDRRTGAGGDCDGGLRQRALLGPAVPCHGPSNPADQSALCEAVRQRIKKRRGGCRSNLRSSLASDHAFCAGQIDRTTGPAVASSCSRACRLCSNRPYQPYARTSWRVWCYLAARRMAFFSASPWMPSRMPNC